MANGVSFDDDPIYSASPSYVAPQGKESFITGMVVKLGVARTEKEANIVLIVLIVACVFLSIVVFIAVEPHDHPLSPQQLQSDLARMRAVSQTGSAH